MATLQTSRLTRFPASRQTVELMNPFLDRDIALADLEHRALMHLEEPVDEPLFSRFVLMPKYSRDGDEETSDEELLM